MDLFQRFDVFQRHSALIQTTRKTTAMNRAFPTWSALIFPESRLFPTKKFSSVQGWAALFQRESALNECCSALIFLLLKRMVHVISLGSQKIEQLVFVVSFYLPCGLKIRLLCLENKVLQNKSKQKWKFNWKVSFWIHEKSTRFRAVLENISIVQRSKILIFPRWSEVITTEIFWDLKSGCL